MDWIDKVRCFCPEIILSTKQYYIFWGFFKLRYKIHDYLIRSKSYSAGISERMADLE